MFTLLPRLFGSLLFLLLSTSPAWAELKEIAKGLRQAHCQHPRFSPDGKKLSYEVRHVQKRTIELRIRDLASGKDEIINPSALRSGGLDIGSEDSRGTVSRELSWSPDSQKYLFSSNGSGSVYDIYLSREGRLKVSSSQKNDGQPAWSSDGRRIVFTSGRTGKGDLYWVNLATMTARQLTKEPESTELFPLWSPINSRQLVYVRHTDQSDRLYLIENVFAPRPKRLTSLSKNILEINPSWSPDGTKIAFFGVRSDGTYDLYLSTLGGDTQLLAKNVAKGDQFGPAWAPDGRRIIFVQKIGQTDDHLAILDTQTKEKSKISTSTQVHNEVSVAKSSSGKWLIAFTAQGTKGSSEQVYRKLYIKTIDPL